MLSDIKFEEVYENDEYKTTTLYFTASVSSIEDKMYATGYADLKDITISVEFPTLNMEPAFASVSYSPTKDGCDYDWNDIDISYDDIEKLIDLYIDAKKEKRSLNDKTRINCGFSEDD